MPLYIHINIHICIHIYVHTYIFMYCVVFVCICMYSCMLPSQFANVFCVYITMCHSTTPNRTGVVFNNSIVHYYMAQRNVKYCKFKNIAD